jgi:hypothetical protein
MQTHPAGRSSFPRRFWMACAAHLGAECLCNGQLRLAVAARISTVKRSVVRQGRKFHERTMRAYFSMQSMEDVQGIRLIPHSSRGKSADAVVTFKTEDGRLVEKRFEMTTATVGLGRGYRPEAWGHSSPVTKSAILNAIDRKTAGTNNQFNAPMGGVPKGGYWACICGKAS